MGNLADLISIISGLMTILGITGFISWSFTKESKQTISQSSISIFAKAFKLSICFVAFLIFIAALYYIHSEILLNFARGWEIWSIKDPKFWWQNSAWLGYSISYLLYVFIGVPIYILVASSIYTWSVSPFLIFWHYLKVR